MQWVPLDKLACEVVGARTECRMDKSSQDNSLQDKTSLRKHRMEKTLDG
jgi:hypothetical protein